MTPANVHGHQDHGHSPRRNDNIRNIADLEHAALARRSPTERLSDLHIIWFAFWILAGVEAVPGLPKFDQFPFGYSP